ncbi:hypothetical protein H5410_052516 [Solanum commersonii]|uniref:Uncharacterized protein n=1 Tax=Solanum commersonii TaxID=4109 RepID=A0A9J5X111_SOLCO|nr:hypothetical protein H5410_052516 [Solanum commersonii]
MGVRVDRYCPSPFSYCNSFPIAGHTCIGPTGGIGHGLKDILEAHKGPFTGRAIKAYMRS